jgi:urease gamma subunit
VHFSPREIDKLLLYNVGFLAQKRPARGKRLNQPEAVALIASQMLEYIRDGRSVAELMDLARQMLANVCRLMANWCSMRDANQSNWKLRISATDPFRLAAITTLSRRTVRCSSTVEPPTVNGSTSRQEPPFDSNPATQRPFSSSKSREHRSFAVATTWPTEKSVPPAGRQRWRT